MRSLLFSLLLFVCIIGAKGQHFHVTTYTTSNGLLSNEVRHVVQDTFGFLWIASDNGLLRFDGVHFRHFNEQLPSHYGRYFFQTESSMYYSHDAGVSKIQTGLDSIHIELHAEASIDPEVDALYYPNRVIQQQNGDLWIGQADGSVRRIGGTSKIESEYILVPNPIDNQVYQAFFAELEEGILLIGSNEGMVYRYEPTKDTLVQIANLGKINDWRLSKEGELWVAGEHIRRVVLNKEATEIVRRVVYRSTLGEITALALDSQGNIYTGIRGKGLYYLDKRKSNVPKFVKVFSNNDPHRVDELPFNNIHNIFLPSDGELFICSSEGLGVLQKRFFESITELPNANTSFITIGENGKVLANFGEVYLVEETEFGFEGNLLTSLRERTTTAMVMEGDKVWVGTSTGQLWQTDIRGNISQRINLSERGEGIFYLLQDGESRLWVCQAPADKPIKGIARLLPSRDLKEYGLEEGIENRILTVKETTNGRIYAGGIGANSYLYKYLPEEDVFVNLSLPFDFYVNPNFEVHDLTVDEKGFIWLGTTDGLLKYDMDRVRKVDIGVGNASMEIRAVEHLEDGSIWFSTDTEGLWRYKDGEVLVIKEESGLPSKVMSYRSLMKDKAHRLWVGTAEGLVYSLETYPEPKATHAPWLKMVWIDGQRHTDERIRLIHNQTLDLEVVTPAFHGYRIFYQYQLDGGEWSEPTTEQRLSIEDLTLGKYPITVRSKEEGSSLWSEELRLMIEVKPIWYKHPYLNYFLVLNLLVFALWSVSNWIKANRQRIDSLRVALNLEQYTVKQKAKDLAKAEEILEEEEREAKLNLLGLQVLQGLIGSIQPNEQWESAFQTMVHDLLRLPYVTAFEIGTQEGSTLLLEGYTKRIHHVIKDEIPFHIRSSMMAHAIRTGKPLLLNDLQSAVKKYLTKTDKRLLLFRSAIAVPFRLKGKPSALFLYANSKDCFDEFDLKTMEVFATYLEQIT